MQEKQSVTVFIDEAERNQQKNQGVSFSVKNYSKCVIIVFTLALVLYAVLYAVSIMWFTIDIKLTLEVGWYNTSELSIFTFKTHGI